jgi:hypothetical protein
VTTEVTSTTIQSDGTSNKVSTEHPWKPLEESLEEELADAGNAEREKLRDRQREMINSLDLSK